MTHPPIGSRHRIVVEVEVKGGTKDPKELIYMSLRGSRVVMPLNEFWEAACCREEVKPEDTE